MFKWRHEQRTNVERTVDELESSFVGELGRPHYWPRGTKSSFTSKVSVLSPGAYFHCFTASVAASTRIGLPPTGVMVFTFPFGVTTTVNLTTPPISWDLRYSGYFGVTRVTSLRGAGSSARTRGAKIATVSAKPRIRNARAELLSKGDDFHQILVVKAHAPIQTIWLTLAKGGNHRNVTKVMNAWGCQLRADPKDTY